MIDVDLGNGRVLRAYDTACSAGSSAGDALPVFWHHGTPNVGSPPEPLFAAAQRHGLRWVSHDRPGYGGSTPVPGRDVASTAADVAAVADALGIDRFAVFAHSGGGAHALACAALLPDRVLAAVSISGLAPYPGAESAEPGWWFDGMYPGGVAELRAAGKGRADLENTLANGIFDAEMFTSADRAALNGDWAWLVGVAGQAIEQGLDGMIDDDLAYTRPWGFDPASITVPVLLLHGGEDRIVPSGHADCLAALIASAELRLCPGDGHISVLREAEPALAWLASSSPLEQVRRSGREAAPRPRPAPGQPHGRT